MTTFDINRLLECPTEIQNIIVDYVYEADMVRKKKRFHRELKWRTRPRVRGRYVWAWAKYYRTRFGILKSERMLCMRTIAPGYNILTEVEQKYELYEDIISIKTIL